MPANANTAPCPVFGAEPLLPGEIIMGRVDACIRARKNGSTAQIKDFVCPAWEFTAQDTGRITRERLTYYVGVNLLMNEADKQVKKYMQQLHTSRNNDSAAWVINTDECIYGTINTPDKKSIASLYREICHPLYIAELVNTDPEKPVISGSDTFPQAACRAIADQKIKMWQHLASNIGTLNVHKSHNNARNIYADDLQEYHRILLARFHTWQKIIMRASSKVKVYIIDAVK